MKKIYVLFLAVLFFANFLLAQSGSYYNSINPNSLTFITDLESRIRSPYTKISYDLFDETNVANFASKDNGNGTRSVFCVYSNYEHIYTGTFSWGVMSREHTYCFSWQPSNSTSSNEYADQHHLFPTQQNNANGVRSNHPLGNVVNVTSTFDEAKFGTNINGDQVYEPRNPHKGDAARALLYMALRYDSIGGYRWTFNWLNNTKLPSLSEGPQDLATLIAWHKQDPPDKWEVDRNNYVQSIQLNRNPLVDHPEYVNYINFNDLSKLSPTYATEPQNYASALNTNTGASSISVNWTDAIPGNQTPSGYLLVAYNKDNYFLPIDGEVYSDDTNLSDGVAVVNVPYSGADTYNFSNLPTGTYYFTIFSYNGSGISTNYKIDGIFSHISATLNTALASEPTNHVTNFSPGLVTNSSIELTWTDALIETQLPEGYLILANTTGTFTPPSDGTSYTDDTNLADGTAQVNVSYTAANLYGFSGLNANTPYYFRIYSYNGSGGTRNYKTDGTIPQTTATTSTLLLATEPTNHVTNFISGVITSSSIEISWIDALAGTQVPEGYIILANLTGTFTPPSDGVVYTDDTNLSDGSAIVNVSYAGANSFTFTSLNQNTPYYFKIYSYNGSSTARNYKTDAIVPLTNATTLISTLVPNAWINEFHYDNISTDINEFIEVVIPNTNTSATELAKFSIVLYNGSGGAVYGTKSLDLFTKGNVDTANGFTYYSYAYPTDGIQNGSPDGIALGYNTSLIQFLSYEGIFTGVGGIANGVLSADIGLSESNSITQTTSSLGLTGSGNKYSDFTWTTFSGSATRGSANGGQTYLPRTLNITAIIEGLFNGSVMVPDTITLELRNTSSPYSLLESKKVLLSSLGAGTASFDKVANGTSFYIVVKHRNSIETWGTTIKTFSSGLLNYDFTSGVDRAYGNNLKQVGPKWCIYSGDLNRDEFIDGSDVSDCFNASSIGQSGYVIPDLNGDDFVDGSDVSIVFNNNTLGIGAIYP
jgi:endonuclease I